MYNKNWSLNQNTSTSNVDWSALADSWMQQREQQVHWQQAPPPLPPPPPPPQFLLNAPPIPPPGPPPVGMSFPPLPPSQLGILPHHHQHQLQVGSNTTQESFTMTNIENVHWRPTPPPAFVMPNAPLQWRPNTNQSQPIFPIQTEMAPSFGGRNFWPPGNSVQQAPPPPVPPPPLPPAPLHSSSMPPPFPTSSFQHPPVDKRMMNSSFNTSIPSLMDLPTSYASSVVPPSVPVPPVSMLPNESTSRTMPDIPNKSNKNDKRRKIPAWLRDALGQMEKEKERKLQNTSNLNNNSNLSINDTSSKFDDDDDDDHDEEEDDTNEKITRLDNELSTVFNDDDDEEDQDEDNENEDSSSALISSTPIVTRRSRFDDDRTTDQQLNISAIAKRIHSPSPPSSSTTTATLIEDDPIDQEEQLMIKLRRALTELLLEVTNEELALLAKEVYFDCKTKSSTPVIRKASGLTSLIQSFSGSDSDDEEKHVQSIINTTVISKTPNLTPVKQNTVTNKSTKSPNKIIGDDKDTKLNKSKTKKSTRERSRSTSHDSKDKKHHHKKHRRHSSSSSSSSLSPSSNPSQSYSHKKKKSSNHNHHSDHRKYDERRRRH